MNNRIKRYNRELARLQGLVDYYTEKHADAMNHFNVSEAKRLRSILESYKIQLAAAETP